MMYDNPQFFPGNVFGTIIALQVGGLLASSSWGWPSIFWATGTVCIAMFVMVTIFTAVTPSHHKSISEDEKRFILGTTGGEINKVILELEAKMLNSISALLHYVSFFSVYE
jgi:MFS family permease